MKLDILAFGAHPDDVELGCGATLAKEIANRKAVGIVDLTRGELGTRGTAITRAAEAKDAAAILGIALRVQMGFADGFFVNDKDHQLALIKVLRTYQPDIVLCNAIKDRHIDHGRGSELVCHACFLSGLVKIETLTDTGDLQKPWRPSQVYHYMQGKDVEPDFVVDVSGFMDIKMKAVRAYKTQFYDKNSREPETPISGKNFLDGFVSRAATLGRFTGVAHAEGYTAEHYITVNDLSSLK